MGKNNLIPLFFSNKIFTRTTMIENNDLNNVRPLMGSYIRTYEPFSINILSFWDNFYKNESVKVEISKSQ